MNRLDAAPTCPGAWVYGLGVSRSMGACRVLTIVLNYSAKTYCALDFFRPNSKRGSRQKSLKPPLASRLRQHRVVRRARENEEKENEFIRNLSVYIRREEYEGRKNVGRGDDRRKLYSGDRG